MAICGIDCCKECGRLDECGGCERCGGHPFGGNCVAAETILAAGFEGFAALKSALLAEINALGVPGLRVDDLNLLNGYYVNLEYPLANGTTVKFLKDNDVYLGAQVEQENGDRCCGVVANKEFLLACEYGRDGAEPELLLYRRRQRT